MRTKIITALLVLAYTLLVPASGLAESILATANTTPGCVGCPGEVFLFKFEGSNPLNALPSIPADLTSSPVYVAFSPKGELFVSSYLGLISRFTFDANGNFTPNGTITGNSLENVHGLAFSSQGELFAANFSNGTISRFLFDAQGNAIPNGTIAVGGYNQGVAFSPNGELFNTDFSQSVRRFRFDPATGAAIPNGSIFIPEATPGHGLHGLAFNAQGELFVAAPDNDRVFRFTFDSNGNPVSNGTITAPGAPLGVAFSSVGELFVSNHSGGGLQRFLFDANGNALFNGYVPFDHLGGVAIFQLSAEPNKPPIAIRPTKGGNAGSVTVTVTGSGFAESTTVKLVGANQPDVIGNPVNVSTDGQTITTTFDLTGAAPGARDVVVTKLDGSSVILAKGFIVEEGGQAKLWVEIIGRDAIRVNQEYSFFFYYGNSGNIDAPYPWLEIALPSNITYEVDLPPAMTPDTPLDPAPLDALKLTLVDLSPISPGTSGLVTVKITPTVLGEIPVRVLIEPEAATYRAAITTLQQSNPIDAALAGGSLILPAVGDDTVTCLPNCPKEWSDENIRNNVGPPAGYICFWLFKSPGTYTMPNMDVNFDGKFDGGCSHAVKGGIHVAKSIGGNQTVELWDNSSCSTQSVIVGDLIVRQLGDPTNRKSEKDINPSFMGCLRPFPAYDEKHAKEVLQRERAAIALWKNGEHQWDGRNICEYEATNTNLKSDCLAFVHLLDKELKEKTWFDQLYESIFPPPPKVWEGAMDTLETIADDFRDNNCSGRYKRFLDEGAKILHAVGSIDPNSKSGAAGYGPARFTSGGHATPYLINFENLATASAPAQEVVITDQLDPAKMDLSTFSLGPITFGDKQVIPPLGESEYSTAVDLRPAQNIFVRINAILNRQTGLLTWRFTSINPNTGQPPEDPLVGFLPPNKNPPEGEGSVLFTVMPKSGLATGTEIRNKATIVFDKNAPIDTLEWLNTLDNTNPESQVAALAATQTNLSFSVQWSGTDVGSGIKDYTIYVSENGSPFTAWLSNTTTTSGTFTGQGGKTYAFYSVARDQAGNVEDIPSGPDASTRIVIVITGDLNGDGRVDCNDLGIVKASFGKRSGQTGFDPRADVNGDGVVDVRDLATVARNLPAGTKCP
jgi:WD40 repeat protein